MSIANQLSGQKILVTGASGFIGTRLCQYLCEAGAEVHAVSRVVQAPATNRLCWWPGDLADITVVRHLLDAVKPDVIFHLAGLAAGSRALDLVLPTFRSHVVSTVNLLTVVADRGCRRLVFPASLEEPDPNVGDIFPSSPYAAAKWASTGYVRMFHALYHVPAVIVRVFMTYGPGPQNPQKLLPYVIRSLLQGRAPELASGKRAVDWIYIDDVVEGLLVAAEAPHLEGRTVDLGSGLLTSIESVVHLLTELIGAHVHPVFGALPDRPLEQVRVADAAAAWAQLGWKATTPLEEGLKKMVTWYRQQLREDQS